MMKDTRYAFLGIFSPVDAKCKERRADSTRAVNPSSISILWNDNKRTKYSSGTLMVWNYEQHYKTAAGDSNGMAGEKIFHAFYFLTQPLNLFLDSMRLGRGTQRQVSGTKATG